jgi:hypothetical protein
MKILDSNFYPDKTSSKYGHNTSFEFEFIDYNTHLNIDDIVVITDMYLNDSIKQLNCRKIAWLLEPREIIEKMYNKCTYQWVIDNHFLFDEIWTHDESLFYLGKCKWIPQAGIWIKENDRKIYNKSKLCSFISSTKKYTSGHQFRNMVRTYIPSFVDVYGRGVQNIDEKIEGLKEYAYSIAIENCIVDTYFTEKIIDCFATGTIPIYWGTSKIINHFNPRGIIHFKSLEELNMYLIDISFEDYNNRIEYIKENFEYAKKYYVGEDR